jgi:hypothetical protein
LLGEVDQCGIVELPGAACDQQLGQLGDGRGAEQVDVWDEILVRSTLSG